MFTTYQKKAQAGEIMMYEEVLNSLADQYNSQFSTLVLPRSLSIDPDQGFLTLPYYAGQTFNELWHESTGGSLLGLDLTAEVPQVLRDLMLIDPSVVTANERLQTIPNVVFDPVAYWAIFSQQVEKFLCVGLLNQRQIDQAMELLREPYVSQMIVNNGDFYPRNFIRTPEGKIVLVDWEPWNAHSPFYLVDYIENVAAVCFVHMWQNPAWQELYVSELCKVLSIRKIDFQKGILIKSLQLADFWFGEDGQNSLCRDQITLFSAALREEGIEKLGLK